MRILVVAGAFAPNRFGSSAVLAEQTAVELQARGHEVFVLTAAAADGPAVEASRWEVSGIPVVGLTLPGAGAGEEVEARTAQVLDVLRPDVVHAHSPRYLGHGPLQVAHRQGIPTVVSVSAADWPVDLLVEAHAVVVSTGLRQNGLLAAGVEPDRLHLIPNGVAAPDPRWVRPEHSGPLRVGYFGGKSPDEGYQIMLEALVGLGRTDYELIVVDRATARGVRALRERDFRVPGLVRVITRFPPPVRDRFFGGIDVLLSLPQDPDSPCLSVREGLLRGVWPIAPDLEGAAQVVTSGRNGILVRRDSAAEVASALAWTLDHRSQVAAARESGRLGDGIPLVGDQVTELESLYRRLA